MAQLVEHHLAKVRVASSNLVVRSSFDGSRLFTLGDRHLRRVDYSVDNSQECHSKLIATNSSHVRPVSPMNMGRGCFVGDPNDSIEGVHLAIVGDVSEDTIVDKIIDVRTFREDTEGIIVQQMTRRSDRAFTRNLGPASSRLGVRPTGCDR